MSELLTLSRKDPRFRSYIEGTFSKDLRAVPIQSLNVNTEAEQVTFRIFARKEVMPPFLGLHWLQVLKVRNFLLVVFPAFLIVMKTAAENRMINPALGILSTLGAISLMAAVNLRNDYLDHLSGLDRLYPQSGSHAIQKGWVTAAEVRHWSYLYLFLGALLGLPSLVVYPQILVLVGILALLGILGMTSYKMGLKYRRWSEWAVFLLLGPLLTVGIQFSLGAGMDLETLIIGTLTGWLAVFYLHLKNFDQLMVNNQAQFENTMTWLGFENGKRWLFTWWLGFVGLFLAYHFYAKSIFWLIVMSLACLFLSLPMAKVIMRLKSPLGSPMKILMKLGSQSILFIMSLWIVEAFWTLWFRR